MRVVFAGTPAFAVPSLQALHTSEDYTVCGVFTQPDRPAGRGRHCQPSAVKEYAQQADLSVFQPTSLKTPEAFTELQSLVPDVMVVVAYGLLLPEAILNCPKQGCINVHASLLPRWRGAAPIQRAILASDQETGITIMLMDKGLDTGDILSQVSCSIALDDTSSSLQEKLSHLGAEALMNTLKPWLAGEIIPQPQAQTGVTYANKLKKQEAWLDWSLSAAVLDCQVRGFQPWPVAYTEFNGQRLRIWQARAQPGELDAPPGTVLSIASDGIDVATGEGILQIQSVQLPGAKRISAQDFVNSHTDTLIFGETRLGQLPC